MGEVVELNEAFRPFPKIARLARECVVTEKLDGSNAQINIVPLDQSGPTAAAVAVVEGHAIFAGSRNRWLSPEKAKDNFGFAGWVRDNADELVKLGPGRHYGEWWGKGIQRGYGLVEKRFSLFNVGRWAQRPAEGETRQCVDNQCWAPSCCYVVPVLYRGEFSTPDIDGCISGLRDFGSQAAPGFDKPEGIIVYHTAANVMFKRTLEDDEAPKSLAAAKEAA